MIPMITRFGAASLKHIRKVRKIAKKRTDKIFTSSKTGVNWGQRECINRKKRNRKN